MEPGGGRIFRENKVGYSEAGLPIANRASNVGGGEASPALVRSEMSSRSNSANAAKMLKTSLPAGEVVSIAAIRLNKRLTPETIAFAKQKPSFWG